VVPETLLPPPKTDRARCLKFSSLERCVSKVSSTINRGKQRLCVQDIFMLDDTVLACLNI
jgi:hypothetical protein